MNITYQLACVKRVVLRNYDEIFRGDLFFVMCLYLCLWIIKEQQNKNGGKCQLWQNTGRMHGVNINIYIMYSYS